MGQDMKRIAALITITALATASMSVAEWLPTMRGRAGKSPFRWCVKRDISNTNDSVSVKGKKQHAFNMMVSGLSDQEILKAFNQPACPITTSLDFWTTGNDRDPMRVACCMDCPSKPTDACCPEGTLQTKRVDNGPFCCPPV